MSSMIWFDKVAEAKRILKSGVTSTNIHARSELRLAAWYLINKTTYTKKQVLERLIAVSEDYFRGMDENYIEGAIQKIMASVQEDHNTDSEGTDIVPITIYQEELDKIAGLGHDDTERLAFIFLCVAKIMPYTQIYECNAELYRLAWRYRYDADTKTVLARQDGRRVGGCEPTKRVQRICQAGIVRYATRINISYHLTNELPPAAATFSVPILQSSGDAAFTINKPEQDSLVLYYDRYKGYGGLIDCERCGKPVLRTGRRQRYCAACASFMNHYSEKRGLCTEMVAS